MTTPLSPSSVKLPATVAIPTDTEPADSSSIAGFVQVIINAIAWANYVAEKFVDGGALGSSTPLKLNGLTLATTGAGGDVAADGSIRGMTTVLDAGVSGGTVSVPYTYERVFGGYPSSTAATTWQLTDPPPGASGKRWVVDVENMSTTSGHNVTVKDASGTTLIVLTPGAGQIRGCVLGWNGFGSWTPMTYRYRP